MPTSASWNLTRKVETLNFSPPPHVAEISAKVLAFVEDYCIPLEDELRARASAHEGHVLTGSNEAAARLKELQNKAKQMGLWALGHPKEIGGGGMPFRDYVYVNEIQGRCELAPAALGTHSLQDSLMLLNHASDEIKSKYLPAIVAADIYPSFAMTEPEVVSSDPTGIQTTARLEGNEWVIHGEKWFTTNAASAEFTSVMVRTERLDVSGPASHGDFSIIFVPTKTKGYEIQRCTHVLGVETGIDHSHVIYNNVRVPASNIIGERGAGFLIAQERLGPGRVFHCMRWLGQASRAFDIMCDRLASRPMPSRHNSNAVLGDKQLMQELIFDSFCDIQALRLMTLAAAERMDSGGYARVELAAVKAWGARALCRVMDRAVQAFGAAGLTDDTPLSVMYRLARAARFYDGPDEVHISNVGRLVLRQYKQGNRWNFATGEAVEGHAVAAGRSKL